jgi:hypothetical protein
MSDAQLLEQRHLLPWFLVLLPVMIIASTAMSLAGS